MSNSGDVQAARRSARAGTDNFFNQFKSDGNLRESWKVLLIVLIVLTLILWAIFFYGNFNFTRKVVNGQSVPSGWKSFWYALVIAAILTIIFYFVKNVM
jgi:hypothetical protein